MEVFSPEETNILIAALRVVKFSERESRLRRRINENTDRNPDVDLEDFGMLRE